MRVLVVHNRYRSRMPSGENRVVDDEVDALRRAGVEVAEFLRESDVIATLPLRRQLGVVSSPLTGAHSARDFKLELDRFQPDVVHLHNPYPLISPRVIDWCHDAGIPVVATIHNFRLACMNGLFFRDGQVCTECTIQSSWPGVRHGCYRDSRPQSVVMSAALRTHRDRWARIDGLIAVSSFVAVHLDSWGFPPSKVFVKPNPVADPGGVTQPGEGFVSAGRLAEEKGTRLLLEAWADSGLDGTVPLVIAGDGPLRAEVEAAAGRMRSVRYVGLLNPADVQRVRRETAVGIQCSLWFEAHPAVAESFALGRPVLATDVGALSAIVDDSVGWKAGPSRASLAAGLVAATERAAIEVRAVAARRRFQSVYREDVVTAELIGIYRQVIECAA